MNIRRFVNVSKDGLVDVRWIDDKSNFHTLASWEPPEPSLAHAVADLSIRIANIAGVEEAVLRSLAVGNDDPGTFSYRFAFDIQASNNSLIRCATGKFEYRERISKEGETEIVGMNQAPITLYESTQALLAQLERYIGGARAQRELEFSGRAVADKV